MKSIKRDSGVSPKLLRKITSLERDNNDLRMQMDEYEEEVKLKWENFKLKLIHDVNEISIKF